MTSEKLEEALNLQCKLEVQRKWIDTLESMQFCLTERHDPYFAIIAIRHLMKMCFDDEDRPVSKFRSLLNKFFPRRERKEEIDLYREQLGSLVLRNIPDALESAQIEYKKLIEAYQAL